MTFTPRHLTSLLTLAVLWPALPAAARLRAQAPAVPAASPAVQPLSSGSAPDSTRPLSLDEAVRLAESRSEAVRIAGAGVMRAHGDQYRARSQFLPQIYGSAGYTRTLRSQFQDIGKNLPPRNPAALEPIKTGPTDPYAATCFNYLNPGGTPEERIAGLEQAARCGSDPFAAFASLPFGQKNQYQLGLQVSQNLFAGGRLLAQNAAANAGRRAADIELTAQRAQAILDVTQAYFDAVLSERLLTIADSTLVQTETVLKQTQLARQVGNTSEFELLRARVTRDNQVPALIQRQTARDVAVLRLKQLLGLPYAEPIRLTTDLQDAEAGQPLGRLASWSSSASDTSADDRATVRQAAENARAQDRLLRVARSQRIPAVSLTSQYGRVAYPASGLPQWNQFSQNWTVGVAVQVPLFVGGRIRGDEMIAQANVTEARARLEQARELAALDALVSLASLRQAEAAWSASAGTAEQAAKAYSIAELRYREGISPQIELSESRILLQQSLANRALAARDLQVAKVRLALLRDLPLQPGGAQGINAATGGQGGQQQQPQQPRTSPQQQSQPQGASALTQTGQAGGFVP